MFKFSNLSKFAIVFTTLFLGTLTTSIQVKGQGTPQPNIAALADGKYQFCSQPDPKDWRDGAGVCFNFTKIGNQVDGYYGYPHSEEFICIQGSVKANQIIGKGLTVSSSHGAEPIQIPKSEFKWDTEGRLTLHQGKVIRTENSEWGQTDWLFFAKANLNLKGFYQYNSPRMVSSSQLCKWGGIGNRE